MKNEINADEAEREAKPLPRQHALAEPAVGDGRGQDRLKADDQRDEARGQPVGDSDEHAREIHAMNHEAGDGRVNRADKFGHFGRVSTMMSASSATTAPMRSDRNVSGST